MTAICFITVLILILKSLLSQKRYLVNIPPISILEIMYLVKSWKYISCIICTRYESYILYDNDDKNFYRKNNYKLIITGFNKIYLPVWIHVKYYMYPYWYFQINLRMYNIKCPRWNLHSSIRDQRLNHSTTRPVIGCNSHGGLYSYFTTILICRQYLFIILIAFSLQRHPQEIYGISKRLQKNAVLMIL